MQDRAHDDVLRKISSDPKWALEMLVRAKDKLPEKAFHKYKHEVMEQYKKEKNRYLVDFFTAALEDPDGGQPIESARIDVHKMIEMVNYLASKGNQPLRVGHKRGISPTMSHGRIAGKKRVWTVTRKRCVTARHKNTRLTQTDRKALDGLICSLEGSLSKMSD